LRIAGQEEPTAVGELDPAEHRIGAVVEPMGANVYEVDVPRNARRRTAFAFPGTLAVVPNILAL
jgi:hypothetical protein